MARQSALAIHLETGVSGVVPAVKATSRLGPGTGMLSSVFHDKVSMQRSSDSAPTSKSSFETNTDQIRQMFKPSCFRSAPVASQGNLLTELGKTFVDGKETYATVINGLRKQSSLVPSMPPTQPLSRAIPSQFPVNASQVGLNMPKLGPVSPRNR